ncbi:phage holin family protein [Aldersonia kunmingensis]|uniref:phage holin family protein n=1 Tax=Aldersonia kunmingensis TaxID=408066 RepID=UPI00082A8E73|nr:phage holin family protein [Aldersonia kunmingensis]
MMRLIASSVVALIANAVALIVGDAILDGFSMGAEGFIVAVAIYTLIDVVIQPLIRQTAVTRAPALIGSTALVATLVALIVTTLVTDSLSISGFDTWILATVIVWAVSVAAKLLLPLIVFRKTLARDKPAAPAA